MATSPRSIKDLVVALASHEHEAIRCAAARNALLPAAQVNTLAKDPCWHVRLAAAAHPRCSTRTRSRIFKAEADSADRDVCFGLVTHPHCPIHVLEAFARHDDQLLRERVAAHASTPAAVLEALLADDNVQVHQTAARHPRVPASVVKRAGSAREAAAQSPDAPAEILLALAADPESSVHCAVAMNAHAPEAALVLIADNRDRLTRLLVLANPSCPVRVIKKLANKPGEYGSAIAASPNAGPDVLRRLSSDRQLADALANNPRCPPDVLKSLPRSRLLDRAIAANPNASVEQLAALAKSRDVSVKHYVALNPSCPPELLRKLAESKHVVVLRGVAVHPHPPVDRIAKLVRAGMWRLLEHPECPDEAFAVPPQDERHRACLAGHARDPAQIAELAGDREAEVRAAAANNPRCPVDALMILVCDRNEFVANAALAALAALDESRPERLRGPVQMPTIPAPATVALPPRPALSPIDPALRNRLCAIDNQAVLAAALGFSGQDDFIELFVSHVEDVQELVQMSTIEGTMLDILFQDAAKALRDGSLQIAGVLFFNFTNADELLEELEASPEVSAFISAATTYEYTQPLLCDADGVLYLVADNNVRRLELRWGALQLSPR